MPEWLHFDEPLVRNVVVGAAGLILLLLIIRLWQRRREATAYARRRAQLRRTHGHVRMRQQEIHEQAAHIMATSSTANITGYTIVRQIEAVFTDGHKSPDEAVEALKAQAARKGANALINLGGQRLPSGKCVANADAVIVHPNNEFEEESPPDHADPEPDEAE
ncbi:MAG: hypothetical protein ABIG44_04860 [Planctomycetota bacterium]